MMNEIEKEVIVSADEADLALANEINAWAHASRRKEVCGMLDCEEEPKHHCPTCGCYYCDTHNKLHFHAVIREEK